MLDRSVSYFLSQYWRNTPLYAEKLIPLLDTCLSNNFVLKDKVASAFYELINKYKNTAELPLSILKEFIREQGYGYILDLVIQDEDTVKLLWYMLVLIHQLKSSKEGLLLVLSLLDDNFDPSKTKITQWYETIPVETPNTFRLDTTIDISKLGKDFFKRFETFLSNYVYPEMVAMRVNYNISSRLTFRPYARVKIHTQGDSYSDSILNGGPASDMYARDVYDMGDSTRGETPPVGGNWTYLTNVEIIPEYDPVTSQFIKYIAQGTSVICQAIDGGGATLQ